VLLFVAVESEIGITSFHPCADGFVGAPEEPYLPENYHKGKTSGKIIQGGGIFFGRFSRTIVQTRKARITPGPG
jgi:hypothetical protein